MANVASQHPRQVDFHRRPVNHAPSPLGFGFGLSSSSASPWQTASVPSALSPWNTSAMAAQTSQTRKRRHEPEDDYTQKQGKSEDAMDRSPTPERPKRGVPKRARTTPAVPLASKHDRAVDKEKMDGEDIDVGVLLASLPSESLLPLLTSLLTHQPSLKPTILSLIPRPTLDAAIQAIAKSAKKLADAFPYSNNTSPSGSSFGNSRLPAFGASTGFGFGQTVSAFGQQHNSHTSSMREEYIISRLRPPIQEFVSACLAYLPYFSYIEAPSSSLSQPSQLSHAESHASALRLQNQDKSHPNEAFLFLHAITSHMLSQPPLTQSSLVPQLLPRLLDEWKSWVDRIDRSVNREGRMFGQETVRVWERGLDQLAEAKGNGLEEMREVRDRWVSKAGWLVGRQPMEET